MPLFQHRTGQTAQFIMFFCYFPDSCHFFITYNFNYICHKYVTHDYILEAFNMCYFPRENMLLPIKPGGVSSLGARNPNPNHNPNQHDLCHNNLCYHAVPVMSLLLLHSV